ncbi:MAG: hypothetical protein CVU60_13545 [Deltaproteobacteria bacterium HGW-Deltaproteobacteria-18]|jgi:hypothetical protein|nr:MAG: hypothetical protein CVU60_13545 [Deltaproteobacteria bacterium HGW-Deltaproteobacteria-18]
MARSKRRIGSALRLQQELEALFFQAVEAGDLKASGYLAQIWVSCENHAKEERAQKKSQKTSIDQLCKILSEGRKELLKKMSNNEGEDNEI